MLSEGPVTASTLQELLQHRGHSYLNTILEPNVPIGAIRRG